MKKITKCISKKMISILLLSLFIITLTVPIISANDYSITLKDTRYEKGDSTVVGSSTITYYTVYVILTNEGTSPSDNITVELLEDGIPIKKESSIAAGETKSFIFTDYISNTNEITVNYYPSNIDIDQTADNSGTDTILLSTDSGSADSTPFLSLLLFISLLLIVSCIIKKRKN